MASKKMNGTVGKSDLEGGFYTFEAGGNTYKLEGGGKDLLHAGKKAEIDGEVASDSMGIGFGTPVLKVKKYKLL